MRGVAQVTGEVPLIHRAWEKPDAPISYPPKTKILGGENALR
jgi:hypothetical protein